MPVYTCFQYVYQGGSIVNDTWGLIFCMLRNLYKRYLISPIILSRVNFSALEMPVIKAVILGEEGLFLKRKRRFFMYPSPLIRLFYRLNIDHSFVLFFFKSFIESYKFYLFKDNVNYQSYIFSKVINLY